MHTCITHALSRCLHSVCHLHHFTVATELCRSNSLVAFSCCYHCVLACMPLCTSVLMCLCVLLPWCRQ